METIIKDEQKILNLETISNTVKLNSEVRVTYSGDIVGATGSININNINVGSFNISKSLESNFNINVNITTKELSNLSNFDVALDQMLSYVISLTPTPVV